MNTKAIYYIQCLQREYQGRLRKNAQYSLRAFAKHLGIAPQVLSEIFRGKRHLPLKQIDTVLGKLNLTAEDEAQFLQSLRDQKSRLKDIAKLSESQEFVLSEERHFNIISQWEHYAVVTLLETSQTYGDTESVARRLGLPPARAQFVLNTLEAEGLIQRKKDGNYTKQVQKLSTTQDIPSRAIRAAHREQLQRATEKLDTVAVEDRFYSATTLAVDKEKIPEIKKIIREFRDKLKTYAHKGEPNEVYQMNIQLFPVTELYDDEI